MRSEPQSDGKTGFPLRKERRVPPRKDAATYTEGRDPGWDRHMSPAPGRRESTPGYRARRALAGTAAVIGTLIWTHALAALIRSFLAEGSATATPLAAWPLTLAAIATAMMSAVSYPRRGMAGILGGIGGFLGAGCVLLAVPESFMPALALVPAGALIGLLGGWLCHRLPDALEQKAAHHPWLSRGWVMLAVVAIVQIARLSTYMTDPTTDWYLSTRHPFYAKHECAGAYFYAAELARQGEKNVYHAAHYPGLTPSSEPHSQLHGMVVEDPFQYAPQFLLWPRLAIALTHDYFVIRLLWFALNTTLCMTTVIALSLWIGGRVGWASALLAPAVLASFPVLHNFQYGQFHFAAVALAVLGLLASQKGRSRLAGVLLAITILSKLFPVFLLVPLAVQRRWRTLAWTAGTGMVLSLVTFALLGPAPFVSFANYHLPRLMNGDAFAFDKAWPELAPLVIAGNQGLQGMLQKLSAMGVDGALSFSSGLGLLYTLVLLVAGIVIGRRTEESSRETKAMMWLGLIGMSTLASAGAWADYVPLTCIWLLALLAPMARGRCMTTGLAVCGLLQVFLLGALPTGSFSDPRWMLPLSLLSALLMLGTFTGAAFGWLTRDTQDVAAEEMRTPKGTSPLCLIGDQSQEAWPC